MARVVEETDSPHVRGVRVLVEFGDAGVFEHEAPLVGVAEFQYVGEQCLQGTTVADDQDPGVLFLVVVEDLDRAGSYSVPNPPHRFASREFDVDPGA